MDMDKLGQKLRQEAKLSRSENAA